MTTTAEKTNVLPRIQLLVRDKKGIQMLFGPKSVYNVDLESKRIVEPNSGFKIGPDCREVPCFFSDNGMRVASSDNSGKLFVHNVSDGKQVCAISVKAAAVALSPLGTYAIAWTRYSKEAGPNMIVYNVESGKEVARMFERSFSRQNWPAIRWTPDESLAAHKVTNQIQFHDGHPFTGIPTGGLHVKRVSTFAMSPCKPWKVATFVAEKKSQPAHLALYAYPPPAKGVTPKALNQKTFFRAGEATLSFSPSGSAVLCMTTTDMDKSGGSYYGATFGHLLTAKPSGMGSGGIALPEPCHALAWAPSADEFIACTGKMPSTTALYDGKGSVIKTWGKGARNTVCWSPHGRFVCVAGFGGLQGGMDFYDRPTLKRIGQATASAPTSWGWSPDSRCFLAATLFPRMRQGVGFDVYSYRGDLLFREEREELAQCSWRPSQLTDVPYPDRPASPKRHRGKDISVRNVKTNQASKKAYVPPRGNGSLSAMMSRDRLGKKGGGFRANRSPLGMAPAQSTKPKRSRKRNKKPAATTTAPPAAAAPPVPPVAQTAEAKAKEAKKLTKKLRQLEKLKAKPKESLNDAQRQKLGQEESIRALLAKLQVS